jgi:3-hydroxybutyryl-CoA dehydrogenase
MNPEKITRVTVVGAGLMGHGIALEFALAGMNVKLHDTDRGRIEEGMNRVRKSLSTMVSAHLVNEPEAQMGLRRLEPMTDLDSAAEGADLVVEAVFEDLVLKQTLFRRLDQITRPTTILASNTSTLMPGSLASAISRPDRLLVTHYFNPPYLLPLVEVVPSKQTSAEVVEVMVSMLSRLGKRPVIVRKEVPGFIGNRLQIALLREALSLVEQGVATAEDVDTVIRSSFGRRLAAAGVFEIFDIAGWDLIRSICINLLPQISSSRDVSPLVDGMVQRGTLGVKSGKGFYDWTPETSERLRNRIAATLIGISQAQSSQE